MSKFMPNVIYLEDSDFVNADGAPAISPEFTQGRPCLVLLQSMSCYHCDNARPAYNELAGQNLNVRICTVQMPGHELSIGPELAQALMSTAQAQGVPCYMLFDGNGRFVNVYSGGRDVNSLMGFVGSL
jgi:hypothetical protein